MRRNLEHLSLEDIEKELAVMANLDGECVLDYVADLNRAATPKKSESQRAKVVNDAELEACMDVTSDPDYICEGSSNLNRALMPDQIPEQDANGDYIIDFNL